MRDLWRAVFKTGSGSAASVLLGMVTVKVFAVVLGPAGLGLFSLLRQVQQTAVTVATLNGQLAVVQGIASRPDDREKGHYAATAMWVLVVSTIVVCVGMVLTAPLLESWIGTDEVNDLAGMIRWLVPAVVFGVCFRYLSGVLNGYRAIGSVALVQVASLAVLAALAYPAAQWVLQGRPLAIPALLAMSTLGATLAAVWLLLRVGDAVRSLRASLFRYDSAAARHFLYLAGGMLVTGLVGTAVPLAIRALTARSFGLAGAGIFDVAWTLSIAYMTLILSSFSTYYLPTLSATTDRDERLTLIRQVLRLCVLVTVPMIVGVVALKPLVVELLYSSDFLESLHIMRWMLIADYLKVTSWVFSFTMIAFADMRTHVWSELLWAGLSVVASWWVIESEGSLPGVGVVFLVLYATYLLFTRFYVWRRHGLAFEAATLGPWMIGLVLIIGASWATWNASTVSWPVSLAWIAAAGVFSIAQLNADERGAIRRLVSRS